MSASEPVEELLRLLALPDSDYWYDLGCVDARTLLNAGGERLLTELMLVLDGVSSTSGPLGENSAN